MKHSLTFILFAMLSFGAACSKRTELAASAVARDFEGQWVGTWSWNSNNSSSVNIVNGHLTASGLPVENDASKSYSGKGEAKFDPQYGSKGAPCVLLYFEDFKEVIPLFITKDKSHLLYTFDINFDRKIIFKKLPRQNHADTNQDSKSKIL